MKQVWICGDSILRGVVWSPEQKRYITTTNIHYPELEEQFSISIRNRSRFGCTLEKGIGYLLAALDRGEKCDVAVLELGGNDSDFNWAEISQTPKEEHFPKTTDNNIKIISRTDGGSVKNIEIFGNLYTGQEVRNALKLRSANFTVKKEADTYIFNVVGYGHGVGMSQHGANEYAKNGLNYTDILKKYYPTTTITKIN